MSEKLLLKLDNVTVEPLDAQRIKNISIEIENGIRIAVVGASNSGKTTLLRTIAGFYPLNKGKLLIHEEEFRQDMRESISFMGDVDSVLYQYRIEELEKMLSYGYISFDSAKFNRLLKEFNIDKSLKIKKLSADKIEILSYIVFVSRKSELFVMDLPRERSSNQPKRELRQLLLRELPERSTLIFSADAVNDVDELAQAAIVLKNETVKSMEYMSVIRKEYGSTANFLMRMMDYDSLEEVNYE